MSRPHLILQFMAVLPLIIGACSQEPTVSVSLTAPADSEITQQSTASSQIASPTALETALPTLRPSLPTEEAHGCGPEFASLSELLAQASEVISPGNAKSLACLGHISLPFARVYGFNLPRFLVVADLDGQLILRDLTANSDLLKLGEASDLGADERLEISPTGTGFLRVTSEASAIVLIPNETSSPQAFSDPNWVTSVFALSPEADAIAVGAMVSEGEVFVFDTKTRNRLWASRPGFGPQLTSVTFGSQGDRLAVGDKYGNVYVWDVLTGSVIGHIQTFSEDFTAPIALSPSENVVAVASNTLNPGWPIEVWDFGTQDLIALLEGHTDSVMHLAFDPTGQLLASITRSGELRIWGRSSGEELAILDEFEGAPVPGMSFSGDSTLLVAASSTGTIQAWGIPPELCAP